MTTPGFCNQCGRAAPDDAIRCRTCGAMLPPGEGLMHPRRLARDLATALGPGFEVTSEIGRGGFARVYTVHDSALDRLLAAKVITPELTFSEVAMERFRREAAMVSKLVHPNIVPVLFVVQAGESPCIVMPFIAGESLHARTRREGALAGAVAVGVVQDVAAALDVAHRAGVIHRDVKPDNILIEGATGRALLADFGIARGPDRSQARLTTTGQVLGTPMYIAPEQAAGDFNVDHRTDIYSLSVVAFEMYAGRPPYTSANPQALYALHITAPIPDVRMFRSDAPEQVANVLKRGLAKAPEDRFESAGELADALAAAQGRTSLRTSQATVVGDGGRLDARLFRTADSAALDPVAALDGASDLGELRAALDVATPAIKQAIGRGEAQHAAQLIVAIVARQTGSPPAMRREADEALAQLASRPLVVALASAWLATSVEGQALLEAALVGLMPHGSAPLLELVRAERRAELVLLADRVGALTDQVSESLATDASPGLASVLVAALKESLRSATVIERRLAAVLRHPNAEVRRLALEAAALRGGQLAEHLGRLALADRDAAVRAAGIDAMAASGRREVLPDLGAILDNGTQAEQLLAVRALARLDLPEGQAILTKAAQHRRMLGSNAVADAAAAALKSAAH